MSKMNTKKYLESLEDDFVDDIDEGTEYFEGLEEEDLEEDKSKDHKDAEESDEEKEEEEEEEHHEAADEPSEIRLLNLCQNGGKLKKVRKLIEDLNVDVNIRDQENHHRTPLIIACENGRRGIVKLLLNDERVVVNLTDNLGQTPLFHACMNRKVEIVKLLLEHERVNINIENNRGQTPFIHACLYNYADIVQLLLESGREININERYQNRSLFSYAINLKAVRIFTLLKKFEKGKLPNIEKSEKVKRKREEEEEEEEYRGDFRLHTACKDGNFIIVQEYLQNLQKVQESFPNSKSDKILNSKDLQGRTPFYCACENQRTEVVRLLLENENVDPNIPRKDGWTPLMHASARGYFDIVELMLVSGREIDVNAQDPHGHRAIGLANLLGADDIVNLLINFIENLSH